ncbi:tripartite tricarboxylate transporter TctB family protein [Pseudarthrobacter raffinosi]|uniref:tripartite tricarboxylate transporter TctB family protein n=1 Tax=Pseudarthrobacter raffinosi TaxID=2953651 RepID=UPI00208FDD55|nr:MULTISPECIES: tripartite tricarboxylate transporter TctB family protein [unclassified Pseudarthrobacter]MCO4251197.1 tripartite tricarboxylate transporter TctB family protein [Pseudarthrobacter sp. MDT3-9]MCO4265085.1 tripartite tricarboxylate transporter TctB family protein [Pseudarthrobacter sp. MDT3-26]
MTSRNSHVGGSGDQDPLAVNLPSEEAAALWEQDKPPAAGPMANVSSAVLVGAIGLSCMAGALALGLGTPSEPGSGMWPFILSVVLISLSVALALLARRITDVEKFSGASWAVLAGTAGLVAFVFLLPVIGFEIPSLVLTFAWLRFLSKETWRMSSLLSVSIVAAFYAIFVLLLGVPLPHLF